MSLNQSKTTTETPTQQLPATILLVEDNVPVAELICLLLQEAGFETRHATTVKDGLRLLTSHPPALIVLDVDLPDGNGFDLCRQLKANLSTATVPVIFCTGRPEARAEAFAAGGVDCVHKPADVFELPVRVQRALDHLGSNPASKSNGVSNPGGAA
jgi:DNA-binding response OmpR family regulator